MLPSPIWSTALRVQTNWQRQLSNWQNDRCRGPRRQCFAHPKQDSRMYRISGKVSRASPLDHIPLTASPTVHFGIRAFSRRFIPGQLTRDAAIALSSDSVPGRGPQAIAFGTSLPSIGTPARFNFFLKSLTFFFVVVVVVH